MTSPEHALLLWTAVAVVALVLLIAWARLNAFVALTLVSLFVGASSGMPLASHRACNTDASFHLRNNAL